jgi:gas vesicle protein
MTTENEKLNGVSLFVVGGLVGAALALILAPQSGKKTRRDIVRLGKRAKLESEKIQLEMSHAINDLVDDVSEKVQDGLERGREWTDKTTQGVLTALNTGKEYIQNEIEKVLHAKA